MNRWQRLAGSQLLGVGSGASAFLTALVSFGGLIFIRLFAACADKSQALGSNLIGALVGADDLLLLEHPRADALVHASIAVTGNHRHTPRLRQQHELQQQPQTVAQRRHESMHSARRLPGFGFDHDDVLEARSIAARKLSAIPKPCVGGRENGLRGEE